MFKSVKSVARRVEDKLMTSIVYGKDKDKDFEGGIKVGNFEAKNFFRYFSLGDKLGQGASAKVFKGVIKKTKKGSPPMVCAIKRVRKFQLKDRKKQALLREVQILRELDHPNIVQIYQFYPKDPAYYYVVLEYMVGGELFDRIVKKETYNEREVRDVIMVLADAIHYIHERGIVHGDLKPSNILLASSDARSLKIADFSMALSVRAGPITSKGGDPEIVAPEILLAKPYLTSPDMWSLGLISYILLTGKHPFFDPDTTKMFIRVAAGDYQFDQKDWRNISVEAKDFIANLLVVDMKYRITAADAKTHPWLTANGESLAGRDLRDNLQTFKVFNAKTKLRAAMKTVLAAKRMFSWLPQDEFSKAYELGDMLGEGAYGKVFKATPLLPQSFSEDEQQGSYYEEEDRVPPKVYAVKRIQRDNLSEEEEREVISEAKVMQELDHPNIVSIYDFYQDDPKHFYMVLELMSGGELFDRIVQKQFYNEAEARDVCLTLLEAMKYCHEMGIVHRDLKPENLLLADPQDDSSIRIADFGFAVSVLDGPVSDQCGTPGYVAPEILRAQAYTQTVDMWSIGVIIYIILAGYPPFHDEDQNRLYRKIKAGHFRFDPEYWNAISSEAKDLIRRLLTVDPERRITAAQACEHPWLSTARGKLAQHDLNAGLQQLKIFNATRKLRAAIRSVLLARIVNRQLRAMES